MSYEINIYFAKVRVSWKIVNSIPVMQNNSTVLYPASDFFLVLGRMLYSFSMLSLRPAAAMQHKSLLNLQ